MMVTRETIRQTANPDTEIVNLQNGPLRKAIAISKSAKRVVWTQG